MLRLKLACYGIVHPHLSYGICLRGAPESSGVAARSARPDISYNFKRSLFITVPQNKYSIFWSIQVRIIFPVKFHD